MEKWKRLHEHEQWLFITSHRVSKSQPQLCGWARGSRRVVAPLNVRA